MDRTNELASRPETTVTKAEPARRFVTPPVDVYESPDEFLLIADMPGAAQDSLRLDLDKGQLTIEGRRTAMNQGRVLASELTPGDYRRAFSVPQGIDPDKVSAELKEGVLQIHLPKSAAIKPRTIQVRAG